VSSPEEAIQLREAGLEVPILAVGWSHPSTHPELLAAGIEPAVFDVAAVEALAAAAAATGRPAAVHLKVDTGMNRLGAPLGEVEAVLSAVIAARPRVRLAGIFTHFADADGIDPEFTEVQHRRFLGVVEAARRLEPAVRVHCANSAATLRFAQMHHDAVRPGIALYGYPPPGATGVVALRPALTVVATVTQVKTVLPGETVGYGRTWTPERPTRVATLASGYADGVQRSQSNRGVVLVRGVRCPMVGRVSMDQAGVDVSAVDGVRAGDEAILVGGRDGAWLGADEVAARVGTISYEVLCAVSPRVPRLVAG
jgi:alanine racemase